MLEGLDQYNEIGDAFSLNVSPKISAEEIQQIAAIQEALLPREGLTVPGARILAYFETAVGAGGDYYDAIILKTNDGVENWFTQQSILGNGYNVTCISSIIFLVLFHDKKYPKI